MRIRSCPVANMLRSAFIVALLLSAPAWARDAVVASPAEIYGELFQRAQLENVFPDSKTFADAIPNWPPEQIMMEYQRAKRTSGFNVGAFVQRHFTLPETITTTFQSKRDRSVCAHIDSLWDVLTRQAVDPVRDSSLLPLPKRYVVPGGRFREIYYWDSYFTLLGLQASGRHDLALDMARNFAFLIDRYGHVPNGNRSYYLSRSQPPFFAAIVELIAAHDGPSAYTEFLPSLEKEYAFWMRDAQSTPRGEARSRVVRLKDGSVLNRYWDDRDTPREESYREDVKTAESSGRPASEVYRNLRAAAESGWDFSSRWLADGRTLETIRTVDLVPPDLNSLLYQLELTLERAYRAAGNSKAADGARSEARARLETMRKVLWNRRTGVFSDYLWRERRLTDDVTAATLYPLYFGVATRSQASRVAEATRTKLLRPDGVITTPVNTGQQWDAPNGWAPLQWIAIQGLAKYGHSDLGATIAHRWIAENLATYRLSGKLVEKYDVTGDDQARGGEYPLQDGFGWTNGVLRKLLTLYPDPAAGCG